MYTLTPLHSSPPPFPKLNGNWSPVRIKLSHYPVWQYLMQAYWNFIPLLLPLLPPKLTVSDAWPVRKNYNSILWPLRIKCNPFHLSTNIAVPGGRSAQIASLSGLGPWCSTKPRPYRVVPPDHRSPAVHPHPSGMPWSGHGHGGSSSSWNRETGKLKQLYRFTELPPLNSAQKLFDAHNSCCWRIKSPVLTISSQSIKCPKEEEATVYTHI